MSRSIVKTALRKALWLAVGAATAFVLCSLFVQWRYAHRIVALKAAPKAPVALVFGAGLHEGQPSPILAERLDAAVALFRAGKVKRILVSGDNSSDPRYHDETLAMRKYLVAQGVPDGQVMGDDYGVSTYDTIVRARTVFGVERAVLVTQQFHLPRALFIANSIGVEADGVAADEGTTKRSPYALRELISRPLALAMVVLNTPPVEGSAQR